MLGIHPAVAVMAGCDWYDAATAAGAVCVPLGAVGAGWGLAGLKGMSGQPLLLLLAVRTCL